MTLPIRLDRLGLLSLLLVSACRPGTPVVDLNEPPAQVSGTLSGMVTGPGATAVAGRRVTAVEVSSGERHSATTSNTGAYTMKIPPGIYRIEVQLEPGERVDKSPGEVTLGKSDLDHSLDIVLVRGQE